MRTLTRRSRTSVGLSLSGELLRNCKLNSEQLGSACPQRGRGVLRREKFGFLRCAQNDTKKRAPALVAPGPTPGYAKLPSRESPPARGEQTQNCVHAPQNPHLPAALRPAASPVKITGEARMNLNLGPLVVSRTCLLVRIRRLQDKVIAMALRNDLQSARQARIGESGAHGSSRMAAQVERIGKHDGSERVLERLAIDLGRHRTL